MKVGAIHSSNNCGDLEVVEYIKADHVVVKFLTTGAIQIKDSTCIRGGGVKDPYYPSVYGVGYIGIGSYKTSKKGKKTRAYKSWSRMLQRCYSEIFHLKNKTYTDCTVCAYWHNFQHFAKWFDKNHIDGFDLDKDIKVKGNKVYSPSNCAFVPPKDNRVEAAAKFYLFNSPSGSLVKIYNLNEFCKENSLNAPKMYTVASGKRGSHKGWTYQH